MKRSGLPVSTAGVPRDEKGTIAWLKRDVHDLGGNGGYPPESLQDDLATLDGL
jgi:hypothetical protein